MSTPRFALDESLGFVLNKAALQMRRALELRLAEHDITTAQWSILARIVEEEGLTQMELGKRSMFDRPTVTGVLNRLEARKLIARRQGSGSARSYAIHLTAAGKALFAKLPVLAQGVNQMAEQGITATERRKLVELLNRVAANCSDLPQE